MGLAALLYTLHDPFDHVNDPFDLVNDPFDPVNFDPFDPVSLQGQKGQKCHEGPRVPHKVVFVYYCARNYDTFKISSNKVPLGHVMSRRSQQANFANLLRLEL